MSYNLFSQEVIKECHQWAPYTAPFILSLLFKKVSHFDGDCCHSCPSNCNLFIRSGLRPLSCDTLEKVGGWKDVNQFCTSFLIHETFLLYKITLKGTLDNKHPFQVELVSLSLPTSLFLLISSESFDLWKSCFWVSANSYELFSQLWTMRYELCVTVHFTQWELEIIDRDGFDTGHWMINPCSMSFWENDHLNHHRQNISVNRT